MLSRRARHTTSLGVAQARRSAGKIALELRELGEQICVLVDLTALTVRCGHRQLGLESVKVLMIHRSRQARASAGTEWDEPGLSRHPLAQARTGSSHGLVTATALALLTVRRRRGGSGWRRASLRLGLGCAPAATPQDSDSDWAGPGTLDFGVFAFLHPR